MSETATTTGRVVVLHGYTADPSKHWFDWLRAELGQDGIEVEVPALSDSADPDPAVWVREAVAAIGAPHERVVVVGHSLGCITALRALGELAASDTPEGDWRLAGLVLVSGFDEPLATIPQLAPFTPGGLDYAALVERVPERTVISSDDDVIVAPALSAALAERLGARLEVVPGAGHFLGDQGFDTLPLVAAEVRRMLA